jgi:DNA-binding CsgD family transcriptional regulator/tetratricopeptide (TPR) repeat protein
MSAPVLVGRAAELTVLADAFAATREGMPGTVLIGGETGAGKSRLIAEFTASLDGRAQVLSGSCLALGIDGLPFAPFTAVLHGLVREGGTDRVLSLLPRGDAGDLGRLLPALGPPADAGDANGTGLARTRLFEQVLTLLEGLAEQQPTVLIIEDAHWADRSSRDLLTFIVRHCVAALLTVVTYRSDDLGPAHPLRPVLADLTRADRVRSLELGRLHRSGVAEQLSGLLGEEPDPELVDVIYRRSGGNPLFVEALLADGGRVPGSLRDLVAAPFFRLPEQAQEVVGAVAAGGNRIKHALLAAVTGWDDSVLSRALRPVVAAHLLEAEEDSYLFRYSLIRDSVDAALLPGERASLHLRYAEILESEPSLAMAVLPSVELADHWRRAGPTYVPKALTTAWRAAADARIALAYAEEAHMLAQVLELWDQVPCAAGCIGTDRSAVLAAAIQAAVSAGLSDRAMRLIADGLAEPDAGQAQVGLLLRQRGELRHALGQPGDIEDLQEAARLIPPGHPALPSVLNTLASRLLSIPREAPGRAAAEAAMQAACAAGDTRTEIMAAINLGYARARAGDVDGQLAGFAAARARAEQSIDWAALLHAYRCEADVLQGAGRYQQAAGAARRGLATAIRAGLARTAGPTQAGNLAEALICLGDWDEAGEILEQALELTPAPSLNGYLLVLRGSIDLARGKVARAQAACGYARQVFTRGTAYAQDYLLLIALEIDLRLTQRQPAVAAALVAEALADTDTRTSPRYLWPVLVAGARAAAATSEPGPLPGAVRATAALLPVIGPVQHAYRLTLTAETSDRAGPDGWDRSADAWARLHQPYPQAQALVRAAEAAAEAGDADAAAGRLRTAAGIADRLAAQPLRERIDQLARLARIATIHSCTADGPQQTGQLPSLTPRERQVLQLVAAGHTNGQIAKELFISVKTASAHVSSILGKLHVSSRVQAATAAYRLHLLDPP